MLLGARDFLGDRDVASALLLPAIVDLDEIVVLLSGLEDIWRALILLLCSGSRHLLYWAPTSIAIENENDTTFLSDTAHA